MRQKSGWVEFEPAMSDSKNRENRMAENKVVIKINYDKDKNRKAMAEPKMVTVWHTRRILSALSVLALIVIALVFRLSGDDIQDAGKLEKSEHAEMRESFNAADAAVKGSNIAVNQNETKDQAVETVKPSGRQKEPANAAAKRPAAIILDKKVIRASLNTGPKDKEPYQPVKLPLQLDQNQTIDLFYFNELRNIKDRALYHYWSKDGRIVYKKQLDIKDGRAKVLSSKTLSYKDKGEWQIQLVDRKGKVFSEVNFSVNPE